MVLGYPGAAAAGGPQPSEMLTSQVVYLLDLREGFQQKAASDARHRSDSTQFLEPSWVS